MSYTIDSTSIKSTLEYLIEEVRNLKAQSSQSQSSQLPSLSPPLQSQSSTIRGLSVSPEPPDGYHRRPRRSLEKMNKEQFKSFRVLRSFQICIYLLPMSLPFIFVNLG